MMSKFQYWSHHSEDFTQRHIRYWCHNSTKRDTSLVYIYFFMLPPKQCFFKGIPIYTIFFCSFMLPTFFCMSFLQKYLWQNFFNAKINTIKSSSCGVKQLHFRYVRISNTQQITLFLKDNYFHIFVKKKV